MGNIILLSILYAGFIAQYAVNIFLTKNLDLDGLGDFNVAISVATICSVIFLLGGDSGLNRFIPRYLENKDYKKIKGYIVYYLKLTLIISFCFCFLSLTADFFLGYYHFEKLLHESYFAMILTPALAVFTIMGESLLAIHRRYASSLTTELLKPLLFLASVSVWLFFNTAINEYEAIVLLLLSLSMTIIAQSWLFLKSIPFDFFSQNMQISIPEWRTVCVPMLITYLANNFVSFVELWSLEILDKNEKSVGAFSLLVFIASIIWVNFTALYYFISSRISSLEKDRQSLQENYRKSAWRLLLINFSTTLVLIFNAETILNWLHGDMVTYKNWLYFILIGTSVNSVLQLASPFLRLSGYAREASIISSRILMISVISAPVMIYFFSLEGAVVSLVGLRFLRGLWYSFRLKAVHGISLV